MEKNKNKKASPKTRGRVAIKLEEAEAIFARLVSFEAESRPIFVENEDYSSYFYNLSLVNNTIVLKDLYFYNAKITCGKKYKDEIETIVNAEYHFAVRSIALNEVNKKRLGEHFLRAHIWAKFTVSFDFIVSQIGGYFPPLPNVIKEIHWVDPDEDS